MKHLLDPEQIGRERHLEIVRRGKALSWWSDGPHIRTKENEERFLKGERDRKLSDETLAKIDEATWNRMCVDELWTRDQIEKKYGMHKSTIALIADFYGERPAKRCQICKSVRYWREFSTGRSSKCTRPHTQEQIDAFYRKNLSKTTAKECPVSPEEIRRLVIDEVHTKADLVNLWGVSKSTVDKWVKAAGVMAARYCRRCQCNRPGSEFSSFNKHICNREHDEETRHLAFIPASGVVDIAPKKIPKDPCPVMATPGVRYYGQGLSFDPDWLCRVLGA